VARLRGVVARARLVRIARRATHSAFPDGTRGTTGSACPYALSTPMCFRLLRCPIFGLDSKRPSGSGPARSPTDCLASWNHGRLRPEGSDPAGQDQWLRTWVLRHHDVGGRRVRWMARSARASNQGGHGASRVWKIDPAGDTLSRRNDAVAPRSPTRDGQDSGCVARRRRLVSAYVYGDADFEKALQLCSSTSATRATFPPARCSARGLMLGSRSSSRASRTA
jgi:hypothetical protein